MTIEEREKAVLDTATTIQTDDCSGNETMEVVDTDDIKALPPVTPTHKKGRWVKYSFPRAGEQHYQCTNCKDYVNFGRYGDYYTKDFIYCPHCGAEMESEK